MIKEKYVVSDANILIDFLSVDLLDNFLSLPTEILTTDFVFHEIKTPEWMILLEKEKNSKRIGVVGFPYEEMCAIGNLTLQRGAGGLSFPDCSVLYLAKKCNGRLLTGDRRLRTFAEGIGVPVSGILFLFNCLVAEGLIPPSVAIERLEYLRQNNPRLPNEECIEILGKWRAMMT